MSCRQCTGIEQLFDAKTARRELRRYRRRGPSKTTRWLIDAVCEEGVEGTAVLDIGGGVGAIQHALARSGAARITNVDAAPAYLEAAQTEAERQGYAARAQYLQGDFVDLAPTLDPADVVTLDRVVCCYPDMEALVGRSVALARRQYALVLPRTFALVRVVRCGINLAMRVFRTPFVFFLHDPAAIDALVRQHGFRRTFHRHTLLWQTSVYQKSD